MAKRAASLALTAGVVGQVTITEADDFARPDERKFSPGSSTATLTVVNRSTVETWFRVDGADPLAGGDESYWLPATVGASVTVRVPAENAAVTVKAVAGGAGALTVMHTAA